MTDTTASTAQSPDNNQTQKAGKKPLRSLIPRMEERRATGTGELVDYIIKNRRRLVPDLEQNPEKLTDMEWIVLRRELQKMEERQKRKREEAEAAAAKAEEREAAEKAALQDGVKSILEADDPGDAAARSKFTIRELQSGGLKPEYRKRAAEIRKSAVRLPAAAAYLGIPKTRLDTWCREGYVTPSFTRRDHITGVGSVQVRHFLPAELDQLDLESIERQRNAVKKRKKLKAV